MYKNIINIWIGLAICAYAGKTNCTECRTYYNFQNNTIKNKFYEKYLCIMI